MLGFRNVLVKEVLTPIQKQILDSLVKDGLTIKEIAVKRGVSQQAIYAQVRLLVKKGWLRKAYRANYEGLTSGQD